MTTDELLKTNLTIFTAILGHLEYATCERHARDIVVMLSGTPFEEYLQVIVDAVITNVETEQHDVMQYYKETEKLFPEISPENDILGRLVSLTLLMVTLRLEKDRGRKARTNG